MDEMRWDEIKWVNDEKQRIAKLNIVSSMDPSASMNSAPKMAKRSCSSMVLALPV